MLREFGILLTGLFKTTWLGKVLLIGLLGAVLSSCGSPGGSYSGSGGYYKVGKPYTVNGKRYVPRVDPNYDRVGQASWYGEKFHGRQTANGERYDMYTMSAAHTTLPMPTRVRVTNLENGRSVIVRVNDRGPFIDGRIIDVSKRAAQELGFLNKGTARVRVQYLSLASNDTFVADKAKTGWREKRAAKAAPTKDVVKAAVLAPPPGAAAAPAPAQQATGSVSGQMAPVESAGDRNLTDLYVQVGTYLDPVDAHAAKMQLQALGSLDVVTESVDGTDYHLLRIGPLSSRGAADATLSSVRNRGHSDARITLE